MKDIAIVILNWNGREHLENFLPSVIRYSNDSRIIVADNGSTDDSIEFLKSNYPNVELVLLSENGGFAKGYNEALKQIEAPFYLLLNSDVEVCENWLEPLLETMKNPKIAGCQPKIRSFRKKEMLEHAGAAGGFLDRNYFPFCRGRIFDFVEEDSGQYNGEAEIFWATGAAMLIRSELFHETGGFDEAFFAHMEEIDMCWRLKRKGYSFVCQPKSVVYHLGGGTLNYLSPQKTYLNFRNSLFMIVKNHPGWLFPKLFYRLSLDGLAALHFILNGEFSFFKGVLRAHVDFYKRLSILLKQRRELKKFDKNPNFAGLYLGSILWAKYFKRIKKFSELNQRLFKK